MSFELTKSQRSGSFAIDYWYKNDKRDKSFFRLGGAAGTGKTFLINYMIEKWGIPRHKILIMAYTGQAVYILRTRGVNAFTIHSQIMDIKMVPKIENGVPVMRDGIPYKIPAWTPIEELEGDYDLILIDEASFVDENLHKILISYGVPVLYVGDHEQLDPVVGKPSFTKSKLDFELLDPMRQALDSPLLRYLTDLRMDKPIKPSNYEAGVFFLKGKNNSMERTFRRFKRLMRDSSVVITSTNKQRQEYTNIYRKEVYLTDNPIPVQGEKLICRRNRWNYKLGDYPLVNGTRGVNMHDILMCDIDYKNGLFNLDFQPDYIKFDYYDNMTCDLDFLLQPFGDKEIKPWKNHNLLEYGEAITVHLSQGAQFKDVMYFPPKYDRGDGYKKKLDYTAGSRAIENLFIMVDV